MQRGQHLKSVLGGTLYFAHLYFVSPGQARPALPNVATTLVVMLKAGMEIMNSQTVLHACVYSSTI